VKFRDKKFVYLVTISSEGIYQPINLLPIGNAQLEFLQMREQRQYISGLAMIVSLLIF